MKNIHIIPTDKPSRLFKISDELKLTRKFDLYNGAIYQNIYITNDEEIKEGDYCIDGDDIYGPFEEGDIATVKFIKIILTTDEQLIRYDVQAIDDEFLEWFVKNPSCEEVKIESWETKGEWNLEYKIVIPKVEPISFPFFDKEKADAITKEGQKVIRELQSSMKQELNLNCFDCNKSLQDCTCMEDTINMKAETIEEAAERLYSAEWDWKEKESFIEGAEWQQERMYSEEEVENLLNNFRLYSYHHGCGSSEFKEWFEQFKKNI